MEKEVLDSGLLSDNKNLYAGFWIRVGASIIDMLILIPFYALFAYGVYSQKSLTIALAGLIMVGAYKPIIEAVKSATFGKMAVKIQVVNKDKENISVTDSLVRNSPWIISSLIGILTHIFLFQDSDFLDATGFLEISQLSNESSLASINQIFSLLFLVIIITVAFTAKKQGLHDMLADTYVIRKQNNQI